MPKVAAVPDAIRAKYPLVDLSKLEFSFVEYYEYLDGYKFQDYLTDVFAGVTADKQTYEYYHYSSH